MSNHRERKQISEGEGVETKSERRGSPCQASSRVQPSAALPPVGIPGKVACMMESTRARVLERLLAHVGKDRNTEAPRMKQA